MHAELEKDKTLSEIVSKLKARFQPEKIFLFGSRASGTSVAESDYDLLLVVKSSDQSPRDRMREANDVLWGRNFSVDIFVYTESEFNELKEEFSSIAHTAATEGLEL
jgi:predicted nucleotidyltransferase